MKKNTASRIGFWASILLAVLGAIFLIVFIFYLSTAGFVTPPPPVVQLASGIITFLTAPVLVVLFTAIR